MNKHWVYGLVLLTAAGPVCAQKNIIKQCRQWGKGPVKTGLVRVAGKPYRINLFKDLAARAEEPVSRAVFSPALEDISLDEVLYGRTHSMRDEYVRSIQRLRWINLWKRFVQNQPKIESAVRKHRFGRQTIAYDKVFDFSSRWIFLGEMHNHTPIVEEVTSFVADFARRHPDTPVYFATEFLDTRNGLGEETFFINTLPEFQKYAHGVAADKFKLFKQLLDNKVTLVGLEDWVEFTRQAGWAQKESGLEFPLDKNPHYAYRMAGSLWGVEHRNFIWKQRLQQLRRAVGPNAYIFVYTGAGHVNRSLSHNLPDLLNLPKAPVITFSFYEANPIDLFLWDGYLRVKRPDLPSVPCTPKNCEHPQKLFMWHKDNSLNKLLGCDGRVWFF